LIDAYTGVWRQFVDDIEAVVFEGYRRGLDVSVDGNAAIVALTAALNDAAGRPYDTGWQRAVSATHALRRRAVTAIPSDHPALARLSSFVDENADLTKGTA